MANRIRRSITAVKRIWGSWEVADSIKALWEIVPERLRKKWKAAVISAFVTGPLGVWWVNVTTWWAANWISVVAVIAIMLVGGVIAAVIATKLDQKKQNTLTTTPPTDNKDGSLSTIQDSIRIERHDSKSGSGWGFEVNNGPESSVTGVQARLKSVVSVYRNRKAPEWNTRLLHWPQRGNQANIGRGSSARVDLIRYYQVNAIVNGQVPWVFEWAFAETPKEQRRVVQLEPSDEVLIVVQISANECVPFYIALRLDVTKMVTEALDQQTGPSTGITLLVVEPTTPNVEIWREESDRLYQGDPLLTLDLFDDFEFYLRTGSGGIAKTTEPFGASEAIYGECRLHVLADRRSTIEQIEVLVDDQRLVGIDPNERSGIREAFTVPIGGPTFVGVGFDVPNSIIGGKRVIRVRMHANNQWVVSEPITVEFPTRR